MPTGEVTVRYSYYCFQIKDIESKKLVASLTTFGTYISENDYRVKLNVLQNLIDEASNGNVKKEYLGAINKKAGTLKERTLLIPKYMSKLTIEEIKEVYTYKVDLVDYSVISEKISNKDKNFAFLMISHVPGSTGTKFSHSIISCEDIKPILIDKRNKVGLGSITTI